MTKKTRLIILLVCVACFLIVAPVLVAYSMGYRFDFERLKVTATGGIYVRTFPAAGQIIIDSKIQEKPGMFSNSIFVQSLIPDEHTVTIEKPGYFDYQKTLPVQENQVTKLENVLLFKNNIAFSAITDKTFQSPFIAPKAPAIKKMTAFATQNSSIIWLGTDGFLYKSDASNLLLAPVKITTTAIKIIKTGFYKIIPDSNNIFLIANGELSELNSSTNNFDISYGAANDAEISPDETTIAFFTGNSLYISLITDKKNKVLLYTLPEKITDCEWLNNNYIITASAKRITISETDYRGSVNTITLPQITAQQISFNRQEGKLYVLANKVLLVSDKITP